jgi:hypothetical protein
MCFKTGGFMVKNKVVDTFLCVLCRRVYVHRGRDDMPQCPSCGCHSSVFPEWLSRRHRHH